MVYFSILVSSKFKRTKSSAFSEKNPIIIHNVTQCCEDMQATSETPNEDLSCIYTFVL